MNDLPTTASGTLNLLPQTKQEINRFVELVKSEVLTSGWISPLEFEIKLKAFETMISDLRQDPEIKAAVLKEAEKHGKSFILNGAKCTVKEVGVKYDYSGCGSSTWSEVNDEINNAKTRLKGIETTLKALPINGLADPYTGEIIFPPAKSSTTQVVIELS